MSPRVSICLPVRNGETYLRQALNSVLSQTFSDFELIIIDDASTDGSWEIVTEYGRRDSRIKSFRNLEAVGLFQNYNKCMERASAEIIKPFAQDDLLHPHMIETVSSVLAMLPEVSLVSTKRRWIDNVGRNISKEMCVTSTTDYFLPDKVIAPVLVYRQAFLNMDNFIGEPSAVAFRKSSIGNGFDSSFYQLGDLEYWLRILKEGQYYCVGQTLCDFRFHTDSASARNLQMFLHGLDFLRLSRQSHYILEELEVTEEEFRGLVIPILARHVHWLVENGRLSLQSMRDSYAINKPSWSQEDLQLFQELAFHALYFAEKSRLEIIKPTLEKRIVFLERRLNELLRSPSWHTTAWLRQVKKVLIRAETGRIQLQPAFEEGSYLSYLRTTIKKIRNSRSWKLTRGLRAMEKSIMDNSFSSKIGHRASSASAERMTASLGSEPSK